MVAEEVGHIVDHLEEIGAIYQINGGWGVDALVGEQTRDHRDLDLFVDSDVEPQLHAWLVARGYRVVEDWRPVRCELAGSRGRVDVHPMVLDAAGNGRQQGLGGQVFEHPVDARTTGVIAGREVVVATAWRQRELRRGYPLRDVDRHDLSVLERLA